MDRKLLPPYGPIIEWPYTKIPPAYAKAINYIQSQVIDGRRGAVEYDLGLQQYVFYLKIEGPDVLLHPVLSNIEELWLITQQEKAATPKIEEMFFGVDNWE